jgi:hypothetical protein
MVNCDVPRSVGPRSMSIAVATIAGMGAVVVVTSYQPSWPPDRRQQV